jgi:hypothetical protein
MSQTCPRCGLFSPQEAARCDCGYDFATKTVQTSYLLSHVLTKHGGEAKIIHESSRAKIRTGLLLLGLAVFVTIGSLVVGGNLYFWGGAVMWGALFVSRGLRQRRQRSLDSATTNDLLKRS